MRNRTLIFLSSLGLVVLAAGVALLGQLTPQRAAEAAPAPTETVYIGEDVCFTCHESLSRDWVDALYPRLIDQPMATPHHTASLNPPTRQVELNSEPGAYTSRVAEQAEAQQYVLQTDEGYLVLPGHWQVGDEVYYDADSVPETDESCGECHVGDFEISHDPQSRSILAVIESNSP